MTGRERLVSYLDKFTRQGGNYGVAAATLAAYNRFAALVPGLVAPDCGADAENGTCGLYWGLDPHAPCYLEFAYDSEEEVFVWFFRNRTTEENWYLTYYDKHPLPVCVMEALRGFTEE